MYDSFSEGGVFYGRTMLVLAVAIVLTTVLRFI